MKNKIIAFGVIFATVLLPVSIILFLNFFGDNRFEIPILKPLNQECSTKSMFQTITKYDSQFEPNQINLLALGNRGETPTLVSEMIRIKDNLDSFNNISFTLIGTDSPLGDMPNFIRYTNFDIQFKIIKYFLPVSILL